MDGQPKPPALLQPSAGDGPGSAATKGDVAPTALPTRSVPSAPVALPLVDQHNRLHRSMRLSITDVCNIRCQYCMPSEAVQFLPREKLLSFDDIGKMVRISVAAGISRFRITGGEPLTRPGVSELVSRLSSVPGVDDLALTTNGMLLAEQLPQLVDAGLKRINISLDTLSAETFQRLSRRDGLDKVLEGIEAAVADDRVTVKLNALVLRDVNSQDSIDLVRFAAKRCITIRFIEFMPLDADGTWNDTRMLSGSELRKQLEEVFGELVPLARKSASQPATDYMLPGGGRVGFIDSVSKPFCGSCDRLRLTAEGKLQNCLFGTQEWDVAELLRQENTDSQQIINIMRECVQAKHAAHGISQPGFTPPKRAMYQIGG